MKILGIDTSSAVLTIAVSTPERVIGEFSQNKALTHSEQLIPHIAYLMEALDERTQDMDAFAVTVGPGSFTGIRIGVAAANAFAMATGKPVIGVSTLEALAMNFVHSEATIITTMYAQRSDYYRGVYRFGQGRTAPVVVRPEEALSLEEICQEARDFAEAGQVIIAGEILPALPMEENLRKPEEITRNKLIQYATEVDNAVRARCVCQLARAVMQHGDRKRYAQPVYIRKPQAEVEYEQRNQ